MDIKLRPSLMEMAELRAKSRATLRATLKNSSSKRKSSSIRKSSAIKKIQRTYRKRIKNKKSYDKKYEKLPDDIKNIIALQVKIYKKKENQIIEFKESNLRTLTKYRDFFKNKNVIFFKNKNVIFFNHQKLILKKLETIINNIKKFQIINIDDPKFKEDFDILKITIKEIFVDLGNVLETLIEDSISGNDDIHSLIEEFYNNLDDEDHSNAT